MFHDHGNSTGDAQMTKLALSNWTTLETKQSHLAKPRANVFASKTSCARESLKNSSIFNGQKYLPAKL